MKIIDIRSRLEKKVAQGDCWEWVASTKNGYGQINLKKKGRNRIRYAHRLMWIAVNGKIPRGQCVLHACDNPRCIRPGHLHLGSKADNSREMVERGRMRGGTGYVHGRPGK